MNPILYDLKRSLLSKTFIFILILMLCLSTIVGYFIKKLTGASTPGLGLSEEGLFLTAISIILSIFIPMLGLLMGYFYYGKDRLTSVLESVIVQPVTRMRLLVSRFVVGVLAAGLSAVITILVMYVFAVSYMNFSLPLNFITSLTVAYFVEASFFVGIIMLLSHIVKTQSMLLALLILIFLVLDIFYSTIADITLLATNSMGNSTIMLDTYIVNPTYFSLITSYIFTNVYSISEYTVLAAGLIWIFAPISLALYLVHVRD